MTALQLEPSAQAPWTRTIFGRAAMWVAPLVVQLRGRLRSWCGGGPRRRYGHLDCTCRPRQLASVRRPAPRCGRWRKSGRYPSQTDDDRLAFQVVAEHLVAHLAAPARFLVAAERQGCVVDVVGVNPDCAGADHLGGF